MNCTRWREQLIAEEAGLLSPQEQQALRVHLDSCADCAAANANLARMFTLLDQQEQPSAQLQEQFAQQLASAASKLSPKPQRAASMLWFQKLWPSRPLSAFSYSLTLLCLGVFGGQLLPLDPTKAESQMVLPGKANGTNTLLCPVQYSPFNSWTLNATKA